MRDEKKEEWDRRRREAKTERQSSRSNTWRYNNWEFLKNGWMGMKTPTPSKAAENQGKRKIWNNNRSV